MSASRAVPAPGVAPRATAPRLKQFAAAAVWWVLSIGIVVAIWEITAALGLINTIILPPPHEFVAEMSPSVTWDDVGSLAAAAGLPVILKGILTVEDALLAVEHGAAGIVVSNHGGRQLDGVAATLDALPEVVDAVGGRIEVLVDGGIRRGTDVLKALALGARAAMAGRAVAFALAAGGEEGVRRVLSLLQDEIRLGLGLLGCTSPDAVGRSHVERAYDLPA